MSEASERDYLRLESHFPSGGDMTLQILKGHLLVEEQLREIFELLLTSPDALKGEKGTSLECHDVICLVEALTLHRNDEPWIWTACKRLNNLRNQLAHNLEPRAIEDKVSALVEFVTNAAKVKKILEKLGVPPGHEFEAVILAMHSCLSKLKEVTQREKTAA